MVVSGKGLRGRRVILFAIRGWADAAQVERYPHHWAGLGQFGRFRRLAGAAGCRDIVIIGTLLRPSLGQLNPDLATLRYLPRIARLLRGGDDHLLSGVARIFEENGFNLIGAHDAAPEILIPQGILGLPTTIFINRAGKLAYIHTGQYSSQGILDGEIQTYALGK